MRQVEGPGDGRLGGWGSREGGSTDCILPASPSAPSLGLHSLAAGVVVWGSGGRGPVADGSPERGFAAGLSRRGLWSPPTRRVPPACSQQPHETLEILLFVPKSHVLKSVTCKHGYDSYSRD